jgi:predicted HTH domain antitoxin
MAFSFALSYLDLEHWNTREECTMGLSLTIEYPEKLPDALQTTRKGFEREARMAMAVKLYELKRLSSGMAAALAGMDRVSFLLSLHSYGAPMIDLDEDELASDVENA